MSTRTKAVATVVTDLDGCLIRHRVPEEWFEPLELLPGTLETLRAWWDAGYHIIILTGRAACTRTWLEQELQRLRVFYHQLVTDAGTGTRYLINDAKPYDASRPTAIAVTVTRNEGLTKLKGLGNL